MDRAPRRALDGAQDQPARYQATIRNNLGYHRPGQDRQVRSGLSGFPEYQARHHQATTMTPANSHGHLHGRGELGLKSIHSGERRGVLTVSSCITIFEYAHTGRCLPRYSRRNGER